MAVLGILWLLFLPGTRLRAQLPLAWDRTYGDARYEELNAVQTTANGILLGGSSNSEFPFGRPGDQSWNFWIAKLDFDGNLLWQYVYGGNKDERLWMLLPTSDGGYLAGGHSYSDPSGDKTEACRGDMDVWIVKLNADGELVWEKTYGSAVRDELFSAVELPGGGFLLGCHSTSDAGGEKSEASRGDQDLWILEVDATGTKIWDKTIGGDKFDQIHDVEWAADGDIYLSGGTASTPGTGEVSTMAARGSLDFWLIKFNLATRSIVWDRRYGGTGEDFAYALCVSRFGKLYLGGHSNSPNAPPPAEDNGREAAYYGGFSDYWLLELDLQGNKQNEWSFGGALHDDLYYVHEDPQGRLLLGGFSDSDVSGNKTTPARGGYDYWLVCLDPTGQYAWQQTVAGPGNDALTKIARRPNGAIVLGGHSDSNAGFEKTENAHGVVDFWVVSTDCDVAVDIVGLGQPSPCGVDTLHYAVEVSGCDNCTLRWQHGATGATLDVPPGVQDTFIVEAWDEIGCYAADTLIALPPPPPGVELGPADTIIAQGTTLTLGGALPAAIRYEWNTGDTTAALVVPGAGTYAVTVTFDGGCTATDAINISEQRRPAVYVPNVFSPNLDGRNDYVGIYGNETVRRVVTFQISDRWGNLVFRRDDYAPNFENDGWNGKWKNRPADMGVYGWFAIIEFDDGEQQLFEGNVTVLR
jgi:gliding motility-associated-like protein